ncbi:MAG: acyltransferase [Proteobacteria bacterium]|nr:acyltransferase [Pseudomonadota bacterium]
MPHVLGSVADPGLAGAGRLVHLESMRGVAALVVVVAHILGAVALTGPAATIMLEALGTPLAIFVNGRAAVIFFFVLSGYVLVLRAVATHDARLIASGTLKRWPRLAGPVLFSTILSSLLWKYGLYFHSQMGEVTGNDWLKAFTFAFGDRNIVPPMGLRAAIEVGTMLTFLKGDQRFNSALWTMVYEFYGSFALFFTGFLLLFARQLWLRISIVVVIFAAMSWWSLYYLAFGAGLLLAVLHLQGMRHLSAWAAAILVAGALYLFGYRPEAAIYRWIGWGSTLTDTVTLVWIATATGLIAAVSACTPFRRALSGPVGRWLGVMSFPIYLVHLPVLLSAGCATYLTTLRFGTNLASAALAAVTVLGTLLVAAVLTRLDRRWVRQLNRLADRVVATVAVRLATRPAPVDQK